MVLAVSLSRLSYKNLYGDLMTIQAIGQICSSENIGDNLDQCRIVVEKAVAAGAKVKFSFSSLHLLSINLRLHFPSLPFPVLSRFHSHYEL